MRKQLPASFLLVLCIIGFLALSREPQVSADSTLDSSTCVTAKVTWWNDETGWVLATENDFAGNPTIGFATPQKLPEYLKPTAKAGQTLTNCGDGWE